MTGMRGRGGICGIFIGIGVLLGSAAWYYDAVADGGSSADAWIPAQAEAVGGTSAAVGGMSAAAGGTSAAVDGKAAVADGEQQLVLHALSAVLMDGESGRVLYAKDGETFRPMASTTKIMTCILALENGNLSDLCTVSEAAAAQPKVHLGAGKGTQFCLKDLLYSLMLESHNDTAVMIAEQVGGSVEQFTQMMNQKARDIGCTDTCFLTPNGLDAVRTGADGKEYTHGTTAADLARIMRYCIIESPMREQFLEITRTQNYSFTDTEGKRSYSCVNHNAFLSMMEGALSGKTGFTGGAGYSYVAALEDEGRTYVVALLASGWPPHKTYKWADTKTLFSYGKENDHYRDVFEDTRFSPVRVEDGIQTSVKLTMNLKEEERHLNLLLSESEQVIKQLEVPEKLEAPLQQGTVAGHVVYTLNGQTVKSYPIFAEETVERIDFAYCLEQILELFLVFSP